MAPDEVYSQANAAVFDELLKTLEIIDYDFPYDNYYRVNGGMQFLVTSLLANAVAVNPK